MLFTSWQFAAFMIVLIALCAVFRRKSWRKALLILASYAFYMSWEPRCALVLLVLTVANYYVSGILQARTDRGWRRAWLCLAIIADLLVLGWFKYAGFLSANAIWLLKLYNPGVDLRALDIVLPAGISFYTFRVLSYMLDVFWRRVSPAQSLADFTLYVAFFPQVIAGPIMRAGEFLPQLAQRLVVTFDPQAILQICGGLLKKAVIADNLAPLVDAVFNNISTAGSLEIWLATLCYSVQIYCDFSGYSDIAIGISRLLGLKVGPNFDRPYFATNPVRFWQRWHISLSTWLRDYLYIPLGGLDAKKRWAALLLTMLLAGVWHGAAWTFIIWGCYHGVLLACYHLYSGWLRGSPLRKLLRGRTAVRLVSWGLCQYFILAGWVIFRSGSWTDMLAALGKFIAPVQLGGCANLVALPLVTIALLYLLFWVWHSLLAIKDIRLYARTWPLPALYLAVALATAVLVILWPSASPPFIYSQF